LYNPILEGKQHFVTRLKKYLGLTGKHPPLFESFYASIDQIRELIIELREVQTMANKKSVCRLRPLILLLSAILVASSAQAGGLLLWSETNGGDLSTAGAGIAARAQDAATVLTNPAGMMLLEGDSELMASGGFLYLSASFEANDDTTVDGPNGDTNEILPQGAFFYASKINEDLSWGVSFANYFGLALDFRSGWKGRYHGKEVALVAPSLQPTLAYRVNDWFSIGGGLAANLGYIRDKTMLNNPGSDDDGSLKYTDTDIGFGANLGLMFELSEQTRIGVQYLSKVEYEFKDQVDFNGLGPILEAGIDASGIRDETIEIDINQPQSLMVSGFHQFNDKWAVMSTFNWQDWSEFAHVVVKLEGPTDADITDEAPMQDTWGIAVGTQYQLSPKWQINGGISYDSKLNKGSDVSLTLPLSSYWRLGTGATYAVRDNLSLTGAFELLWEGGMSTDTGVDSETELSGRVAGRYNDVGIYYFNLSANWQFGKD
jgi:long-chain fatty acid transport protein